MNTIIFLVALTASNETVKLALYNDLAECEQTISWMFEHKTQDTAILFCKEK